MTDFLTSLVERSQGRASQLKPLIAPMFAAGPGLPTSDPMATEPQALELDSEAPPPPRSQQAAKQPTNIHAINIADSRGETSGSTRRSSDTPPAALHELKAERQTPAVTPMRARSDSIHPQPSGSETDEARSRSPKEVPLNRSSSGTPEPAVIENNALASDRTESRPVIRPRLMLHNDQANRQVHEQQNGARESLRHADATTPTIRITIGRIDVRAIITPEPPVRRATPQAPKLSLEDYLRTRNGGKE